MSFLATAVIWLNLLAVCAIVYQERGTINQNEVQFMSLD
jgi:hypothetical protein